MIWLFREPNLSTLIRGSKKSSMMTLTFGTTSKQMTTSRVPVFRKILNWKCVFMSYLTGEVLVSPMTKSVFRILNFENLSLWRIPLFLPTCKNHLEMKLSPLCIFILKMHFDICFRICRSIAPPLYSIPISDKRGSSWRASASSCRYASSAPATVSCACWSRFKTPLSTFPVILSRRQTGSMVTAASFD